MVLTKVEYIISMILNVALFPVNAMLFVGLLAAIILAYWAIALSGIVIVVLAWAMALFGVIKPHDNIPSHRHLQ